MGPTYLVGDGWGSHEPKHPSHQHVSTHTPNSNSSHTHRTHRLRIPITPTTLDYTITLPKTTALISKVKRRKAPGQDQTTTDMLKAAPSSTARHVHPLLLKVTLSGQEPLVWKHGTAIPLHKGQGNTSKAGGLSIFKDIQGMSTCDIPTVVSEGRILKSFLI